MTTIKCILVVIDPTASSWPAFERALMLAKRSSASLELTICSPRVGRTGQDFGDQDTFDQALAKVLEAHTGILRELAARAAADGLAVNIDARGDYAPLHDAIIRKALDCGADLVVKDTHYHSALNRSLFSNTDWSLIRGCPTSLWLAKSRAAAAPFRIVAAVDPLHEHDKPAELDHRLLATATTVCTALSGDLHVFHAFDILPMLNVSGGPMTSPISPTAREMIATAERRHADALHALTDEYGIDRNNVHLERGETRGLLIALTERLRADLVVMGAVSRSGLKRLFIGSTAEAVLDKLSCDVLVVKPNHFETPEHD